MDKSSYDRGNEWRGWYEESYNTPNFHLLKRNQVPLPIKRYSWQDWKGVSPWFYTYNGYRQERSTLQSAYWAAKNGGFKAIGNANWCTIRSMGQIEAQVKNRLLQKVRDKEVDLGTTLGEYSETAKMVVKGATTLRKALKSVRKGDIQAAMREIIGSRAGAQKWSDVTDTMVQTYFLLKFGIQPLAATLWDAMEKLQDKYKFGKPDIQRVRTKKQVTFFGASATVDANPNFVYSSTVNGSYTFSGEVAFGIDNPLLRQLDQCGVLNPLSIVWEVTPMSFVVDWFLPVGAFFEGVVPPQGVSFVSGWLYNKGSGQAYGSSVKTGNQYWVAPGYFTEGWYYDTWKLRVPLSAIPKYQLTPPTDISFTAGQVVTSIALLYQQITKIKTVAPR